MICDIGRSSGEAATMNSFVLVCCFVMLDVASIMAAPVGLSPPFQRHGRRPETKDDVKNFLRNFGHWQTRARNSSNETDDDMGNSLRGFQRFYRLNVTGRADNETLEMMGRPRCGVPDNATTIISRRKRFSLPGAKWSQKAFTYLFQSYTSDLPVSVSRSEIQRSFKDWSDVTPLSFTESKSSSATLKLLFARLDHGDGDPFDGPKGVLAHAFFPTDGRTHFDDDEQWTTSSQGINLRQVATHEIGHALGLVHSRNQNAIMYPAYYYRTNFALHADDIKQIQALYGKPQIQPPSRASVSTPSSSRTPIRTTRRPDRVTIRRRSPAHRQEASRPMASFGGA